MTCEEPKVQLRYKFINSVGMEWGPRRQCPAFFPFLLYKSLTPLHTPHTHASLQLLSALSVFLNINRHNTYSLESQTLSSPAILSRQRNWHNLSFPLIIICLYFVHNEPHKLKLLRNFALKLNFAAEQRSHHSPLSHASSLCMCGISHLCISI